MNSETAERVTPLREPVAGQDPPAVLYAYTPQRIKTILGMRTTGPAQRRLLLGGLVLGETPEQPAPQWSDEEWVEFLGLVYVGLADPFEEWLVRRWLREARSEAFRESAEYEYLRAEWERAG